MGTSFSVAGSIFFSKTFVMLSVFLYNYKVQTVFENILVLKELVCPVR